MTQPEGGGGTWGDSAKWREYYVDGPLDGCRTSTDLRALGAVEVAEVGGQWRGFVLGDGDVVHWYHAIEAGPQGRRFHHQGTTRVGDPLIPPDPAEAG